MRFVPDIDTLFDIEDIYILHHITHYIYIYIH